MIYNDFVELFLIKNKILQYTAFYHAKKIKSLAKCAKLFKFFNI
jgi:hypothetical protein